MQRARIAGAKASGGCGRKRVQHAALVDVPQMGTRQMQLRHTGIGLRIREGGRDDPT